MENKKVLPRRLFFLLLLVAAIVVVAVVVAVLLVFAVVVVVPERRNLDVIDVGHRRPHAGGQQPLGKVHHRRREPPRGQLRHPQLRFPQGEADRRADHPRDREEEPLQQDGGGRGSERCISPRNVCEVAAILLKQPPEQSQLSEGERATLLRIVLSTFNQMQFELEQMKASRDAESTRQMLERDIVRSELGDAEPGDLRPRAGALPAKTLRH